ncbi:hypothetical protein Tco_1288887 [Tanacetum coccineum]
MDPRWAPMCWALNPHGLRKYPTMAYDDKVNFIRELEAVPNIDDAVKTAKFLTDNLSTDDKRVREMINIEIEIELSSEHKGYFNIARMFVNWLTLAAFLKKMVNPCTPLLRELAHAADSNDIRDQLSVLFRREVVEDLQKMEDYRRLSSEMRKAVRMRDGYICEL